MKLTYRGISYDYNPPHVELGNPVALGIYRGSSLRVRKFQTTLAQQPGLDLKYRGVAYNTQPLADAPIVEAVTTPATPMVATSTSNGTENKSVETNARSVMMNHHRMIKQRQQSILSRFAAEVGVPVEYAAHYWNPIQGKINPVVWDVYDRSHVAFS